jgi:outer-membrane receptor for ferric coprogen and ferric-rhodotorulic acid
MAGAGNPGGTVNLVRKRPLDTFHLATETQVTSLGGVRQTVDVTGPLNKDGTLRGRLVVVGSDEHQSIDRSRTKEVGLYGILEYDINPRTTVAVSGSHEVIPVSGFDYGIGVTSNGSFLPSSSSQNFSPSWNYQRMVLNETNITLTHAFENNWQSATTLLYRHYSYYANYAYPLNGYSNNLADYWGQHQQGTDDWFGADTHVSGPVHLLGRDHTLTFGADYTLMTASAANGGKDIGTYNIFDAGSIPQPDNIPFTSFTESRYEQYGIYGQAKFKIFDPLSVTVGARELWYQQESGPVGGAASISKMNGKLVPYAGIVYDLVPNISAYVSYSTIFAPQTGTTSSGQTLDPASGKQYEAGLKGTFMNGRLLATVAAFRIDNDHYAISDPSNPSYYLDAGKVRSQGWETEVSGEPLPGWNLYAGYTLLSTRYLNGGSSTGQTYDLEEPRSLFKLWTTYHLQSGPLRGWSFGGGMLAQSATSRGSSAYEQGGYAVFDAQVGDQINKHVSASLTLNNMFNRVYYVRVPSTYFGEFGDRRNVMLTVRTDF